MKEEKKLLIFHPTIAPYRIDFFNALNDKYNTRICLQYINLKSQTFDYKTISDQFNFNPIYLPVGGFLNLCKTLWSQINDFAPDIVLSCEFGSLTLINLLIKLIKKEKFKLVVMTDDSFDMVANGNDFSVLHRIGRYLLSSKIDDFIVVNPKVAQWYQKKHNKGIYFPIIVDDNKAVCNYERLLGKSQFLASKYNLESKKVLLSVSRLVGLKNLHRVIDAFAQCQTDATLVIIGDGPDKNSLEDHAAKVKKDILFTGRLEGDELYAWYNIATVFILASYKEAFGAVTNEALLAGCRVVISEKAGSSCLVCQENGVIIDPYDLCAITKAIDKQLSKGLTPDYKKVRKNLMKVSFADIVRNLEMAIDK